MNFVIALRNEARPLVEKFKLSKISDNPFPLFGNKHHRLIISGIGRISSAAATGYLLGKMQFRPEPIINFGLAGHGEFKVGDLFLANRIFHEQEKNTHYPPQLLKTGIPSSALQTCDLAESNYLEKIGYDMEAHAFCTVSYKSITRELVQVLKLVSDNPIEPLSGFDPQIASKLIYQQINKIEAVVMEIDSIASEIQPHPVLLEIMSQAESKLHFSETQRHQLSKLIIQSISLGLEKSDLIFLISSSRNSRVLLDKITKKLEPLRILK
jgi:adenosylhomocysteine nucleosidase|tara:strand:+ start:22 stop:825 length:804 start_codon:yes stop_codon:yes gene_type:complete